MGAAQRRDHRVVRLLGEDGLESELCDTLLPPPLADRRVRVRAAEEGAGALGVPGAALVVADAPGARGEEGVSDRVE
jgi:hypothetical protein